MKELIDTTQAPLGLDREFPEEELWVLADFDNRTVTGADFAPDLYRAWLTEADAFAYLVSNRRSIDGAETKSPSRMSWDHLRKKHGRGVHGVVLCDREGKEITRRYWD